MTELIILVNSVLLAVLGGMGRQIYRVRSEFTIPTSDEFKLKDVDLPSVTVCIPARKQEHALIDSLQQVLRSEYPKLEIIVLDDASTDNTTALIKSFASEGVRFVEGSPLAEGWLGKNHALNELLDEASGAYVLFMDVDTHMQPKTLRYIIEYALSKGASMVSVLPRRDDSLRASVMLSPLRFFWEVIFHRKETPASADNAWLVRRDVFSEDGFSDFKTLRNTAKPEGVIAAKLAKDGRYRFTVGSAGLGLSHQKKWNSQLSTSVRLLYPMLGGKWYIAAFAALDLIAMLVPFTVIVVALLQPGLISPAVFWLSLATTIGYCALYALYARRVWARGWVLGAIIWPALVVQDIILLVTSVVKYSRGTVTWKGRPVRLEEKN